MSKSEIKAIIKKRRDDESLKAYREYVNKYYPKKQAKQMIKDYKEKLKGLK